jgi:DNA-binding response OmpR family regulator
MRVLDYQRLKNLTALVLATAYFCASWLGERLLFDIRNQVFTRLQLLREVQGYTYDSFARTIDTHVKNLRRKIEQDPKEPRYILTVHGVGYRFAREA